MLVVLAVVLVRLETAIPDTALVVGLANVVNVLGAFVGLSAEELLSTKSERRGDLSEASGGHQDEGVLHCEVGFVVCCEAM